MKKINDLMKKDWFVLVSILVVLLGIAATFAPADRYVSEWVLVQAGEIHNFDHKLGTRPLEVFGWAALHVTRDGFNEAVPLDQVGVEYNTVNPYVISVHNVTETDWMIQVVASR